MLLAIDIGNTSSSFGIFQFSSLKNLSDPLIVWEIPSKSLIKSTNTSNLKRRLSQAKLKISDIHTIYISSVVPHINNLLKKRLKNIFKIPPVFISARSRFMVPIRYKAPNEVGADRIVNAKAALAYHRGPLIVVDFGTATTFDCVSDQGEYLGGVIAPGPVISAQALFEKTAQLPFVTLSTKAPILGSTTVESIEAGLYHGYRGMVNEILYQLKIVLGQKTYVIATGGQAKWILKDLAGVNEFIPELTLKGLYLLWIDNEKTR